MSAERCDHSYPQARRKGGHDNRQGLWNPLVSPRQLKDMKPELGFEGGTQLQTEGLAWWDPDF